MKTEQTQWLKAEEDFHKWIEEPESYPENEYTNLRKSIHIVFRRNYHNQLTPILKKVFEDIPPESLLREKDNYAASDQLFEPDEKEYSNDTHFSLSWSLEDENKRILDGFWKDDYKTIAEFYENEFSKIAFIITKNNGTIEDAKDVFQDAVVILMDNFTWGKLDLINCSLGTYIYSISRNLWYSQLRAIKKEKEFVDLEQHNAVDISADYYTEEPEDYERVNSAISGLGKPCKELLELFYFENHSWETIAMVMGYSSPASAKNQKYKCLQRVRSILKTV